MYLSLTYLFKHKNERFIILGATERLRHHKTHVPYRRMHGPRKIGN